MKSSAAFLVTFTLLLGIKSFAQQKKFEFENFTQSNGLPSNESYFVYRDSKNFLWIATDQGVVRYNGSKMEKFDLPDNVVFKIKEDSKGRIWFFSHTGKLAYFFNGAIQLYKYNSKLAAYAKTILISDAYVTDDDEVIISATYQNFRISNSGTVTIKPNFNQSYKDSTILTINEILPFQFFSQQLSLNTYYRTDSIFLTVMRQEKIIKYILPVKHIPSNQHGCLTLNGKDLYFFYGTFIVRLNADGSYKVKTMPAIVLSMSTRPDNTLWAGTTKHGAFLLNADLTEAATAPVLSDKSISSITEDNEGGTWFSSLENGVYYQKNIHIYKLNADTNLMQNITRLYNVHDSSLLFTNLYGIQKFSKNSFSTLWRQQNDLVSDVFLDDNNNIYLCGRVDIKHAVYTLGNILKTGNPVNKHIALVTSSHELSKISKYKYLCSQGNTLGELDFSQTLVNNGKEHIIPVRTSQLSVNPSVIFYDQRKQAWLGTVNNLYKLRPGDMPTWSVVMTGISPVAKVLQPFKDSLHLFTKGVTAMRQMESGLYTIGIRFGGIVLMQDSIIIANITEADGLLSNSIKYLLPLKNQLWIATAKGVSVINFQSYSPLKYTITNIGRNEGFYNVIINQLITYQGNIMAATSAGIYVIEKPSVFFNHAPLPLPLYISSINYYKGDTSGISTLSVPYASNRIRIKYNAICFNAPEEIKYYYRFDNNDTAWQTIAGTELLLENLSPGTYKLELKAAVPNQHRYSAIQKLEIKVEKPWWQNNWLRLLGILALAGIVLFIYQKRIKAIQKKEMQKSMLNNRMIELEQTALRSQMNPHFIFNCLTSIQQLIVGGYTTDANEYLVKFARLIRKTLDLSAKPYIRIIEEKEYLEEYLFLEQLRMPGEFDYSIEIDPGLDINRTEIPNMMLQPIVENCIRHGIKHLEDKKGRITVSIQKMPEFIFCSITDNGVGRNGLGKYHKNLFAEQKSYGMGIVKKRLELMSESSEGNFFIEIKDLHNEDGTAAGTQVIIQLPFKMSVV